MSIAQQNQLRDLTQRVTAIESSFRDGAEIGNSRQRLDNLETTVSGILLELSRLSKALIKEAATQEPQGASCQSSEMTKSAPSSAPASVARSTAPTASSGASANKR